MVSKPEILAVTTADGVSSELRLFAAPNAKLVVLVFPAMGVPARKYDALASALNDRACHAAVAELRGLGSSSVRASRQYDFGYHELVTIDFPQVMSAVRQQFPSQTLLVFGHSLGGQLAALMLAQQQANAGLSADGLVLNASCSIDYRGWPFPKNISTLLFTQFGAAISQILGYFPGQSIGFGGREARTMILDWAHSARTGRYRLSNNTFDFETALQALQIPILAINYADDNFAPPTATEKLLIKMPDCTVHRVHLDKDQLGVKSADHFSWMRAPNTTAEIVKNWRPSQQGKAV